MAKAVLLDTGVLVALINRKDPDHENCLFVWKKLRAQIYTVEGVLVEAAHMLRKAPNGPRHAIELVLAAKTKIVGIQDPALLRAMDLMDRYRDVPMDFVDALLVAVSEDLNISEILTLDRRGFETYRIFGKRRFTVLP